MVIYAVAKMATWRKQNIELRKQCPIICHDHIIGLTQNTTIVTIVAIVTIVTMVTMVTIVTMMTMVCNKAFSAQFQKGVYIVIPSPSS